LPATRSSLTISCFEWGIFLTGWLRFGLAGC
jgi:hypothetical protein